MDNSYTSFVLQDFKNIDKYFYYMIGTKISELPLETVLKDTDELLITRGDLSKRVLGSSIIKPADIGAFTTDIVTLSTQTINVFNSPTVNLGYNNITRTLSADVSVIPIAKGGTGQTNFLENSFLFGTSTGQLEQRQLSAGLGFSFYRLDDETGKYLVITNTSPFTGTNLSNTATADTVILQSNTGTNTTVQAATEFVAGVMNSTSKTQLNTLWTNLCAGATPFVSLERPSLTSVNQALNSFLYVSPSISYFRINGASSQTLEVGQSLVTPALTWTSNKIEPQAVSEYRLTLPTGNVITNTYLFSAHNDLNTYTISQLPGAQTQQLSSWLVRVTDWNGAQSTSTASASWQYRVYYGVTSAATPTSTNILNGVSSDTNRPLATSRLGLGAKTVSPANQYFYVAYSSRLGTTSTLKVNGLNFNDFTQQTITPFTNSQGGTDTYYVYRSNNLLTSTYTIEIV